MNVPEKLPENGFFYAVLEPILIKLNEVIDYLKAEEEWRNKISDEAGKALDKL